MSGGPGTFEIDDQKSIDDNLSVFAAMLAATDAELASVLALRFPEWSRNKSLDYNLLWDDLLKAIEPVAGEIK